MPAGKIAQFEEAGTEMTMSLVPRETVPMFSQRQNVMV